MAVEPVLVVDCLPFFSKFVCSFVSFLTCVPFNQLKMGFHQFGEFFGKLE